MNGCQNLLGSFERWLTSPFLIAEPTQNFGFSDLKSSTNIMILSLKRRDFSFEKVVKCEPQMRVRFKAQKRAILAHGQCGLGDEDLVVPEPQPN